MPNIRIQKLNKIYFKKLKGLEDLEISFEPNLVTGIFGVNGCGKSTILHAIACFYKTDKNNGVCKTNYFTRFFKKVNRMTWQDSEMIAYFDINGEKKEIRYTKESDRWMPRVEKRIHRDCYYIGIESCVPIIEKETVTKTSYSMTTVLDEVNCKDEIIIAASNILNRSYNDLKELYCGNKKYRKVIDANGKEYSSLSMGAGEQRLFTILEILYQISDYSILLIDELDLTLHTIALQKLVDLMVEISREKNIQIIFTSHREELAKRLDINIRHIWNPANQNKTLCLNYTDPLCLKRLTGYIDKEYEVFVEDELSQEIVRDVLKEMDFIGHVDIHRFGDAENAFTVAGGLTIQNNLDDKKIILLDGDVYKTEEDKLKQMKRRFSGNEIGKDEIRRKAIIKIKQLNLPEGEQPEHYLWTLLKSIDSDNELIGYANELNEQNEDKHKYLDDIYKMQFDSKQVFYHNVIKLIKDNCNNAWVYYTQDLRFWITACKRRLSID